MGIAEKALVLKRDFDEVYKAGASDFGLKGKGQGEFVHFENVHPIKHAVLLAVSDPTAKVKVTGKNLFNPFAQTNNMYLYAQEDGSFFVSTMNTQTGINVQTSCTLAEFAPTLRVGETYILNANTTASNCKYFYLTTASSVWSFGKTRTITEKDLQSKMYIYAGNPQTEVVISNIQIELGTTATEYEPYQATEYTAAADGTVEGVKSISPVMNLMADKAGAVIDAECFLDPQAVITDLTNTVITLGGEI